MKRRSVLAAPFALVVIAVTALVAGCGSGGSSGGGASGTLIQGTIDKPVSYDPAGSYDLPSYNVIFNVYQNLLQVPPGGNKAEPELAKSCEFTDEATKTFKCTLKSGVKFSDGSTVDSTDVKDSFVRNVRINDPQGAASTLYAPDLGTKAEDVEKAIETPDKQTVIFHLTQPDATWPFALTSGGAAIVPSEYPQDKLQPDEKAIGSGRFKIAEYKPGDQTVLEKNPNYNGSDPAKLDRVIIKYYDKSSALKQAVEQGEVDLAYRSLSPTDVKSLEGADGVSIVKGPGAETRYLAVNEKLQDGTDAQKLAVRQALAQVIDRDAIANDVYNGTAKPLYSTVPAAVQDHTDAFKTEYGAKPDVDAATDTLKKAGVKTPVPLELWWTPTHYGPASGDEYAEIKRELDGSKLFDVTLKSTEWDQYSEAAFTDKYPGYQIGWFPDFPDPDNYLSSFYLPDSFLNIHYDNSEVNKEISTERGSTDAAVRSKAIKKIQEIGAKDAPLIPYVEFSQVAAARDGVEGVSDTLDPSYIFRYWLISKD